LKFRISNILLFIAILAISLGWWCERSNRNRVDLIGIWRYPTPDVLYLEYRSVLTILSDGSFTKTQYNWNGYSLFEGTYQANEDGTVTFSVESRKDQFGLGQAESVEHAKTFRCRCGFDRTGYLVIDDYGNNPNTDDTTIVRWDTYIRESKLKPELNGGAF